MYRPPLIIETSVFSNEFNLIFLFQYLQPCTCGVDCAAKNAGNDDDAVSKVNNIVSTDIPTESPTLKRTLEPTPKPTSYPTETPTNVPSPMPVTSIPTSLHDGIESKYVEPTLRPSLNPSIGSSSSSSSSDGVPYIIIGDRSEKSPTEGADNIANIANETVSTDQNIEEKSNMVLTAKQLLIICAGIAGLAFLSGIVFQLARGRSNSGEKDQENKENADEDFVIEVGHDGHRHRKGSGGCSTTACSSEMASEVQYFTYINRTVKNNRTVLAFEKNSNAWSKRLPFTKSYKARREEEKEQENYAVDQNVDVETGVQGEVESGEKRVEESYEDCEGPIPVIFSHDEEKLTPPAPKKPATKAELQKNTAVARERSDERSASRSSGQRANRDRQRVPRGGRVKDDESDVSYKSYVNAVENRRRRRNSASHRATYSRDYGEQRQKHRHYDNKRSRSRKYREQAGDCGLAGLGQCFDAENFDSYDTYDDYSAFEKDMHLIKAKTTETYGYSYDYDYVDEINETSETLDQETLPSQRGYGEKEREADLTLSATRRRLEDNGGAWSKMLKRSLEDGDDKYNCA